MTENIRFKIIVVLTTLVILIAFGTFMLPYFEKWNYIQSFYFTVSTITTVGYGDLAPTNDSTRLFVSIYMLISVTLYISTATIFGSWYIESSMRRTTNFYERIMKKK